MKLVYIAGFGALALALAGFAAKVYQNVGPAQIVAESAENAAEEESSEPAPAPEAPAKNTASFVDKVMETCGAKLSPARRKILAAQLGRAIDDAFKDPLQGEAFIALLCIESKFEQVSKSSAGAQGIAQLMPKSAEGFAKDCGYGEIAAGDIQDTEVNVRLGACFFAKLLEQYEGNTALALAAYNSGAGSKTVQKLTNLGTGAEETSGYLAKHYVLSEKLKKIP